ncbi:riboflavin synthase [Chelatococcus reniformis]|uniref:Riboflavin synthase n=1 Tax=Chelatococcus reniformis TaxID=1494448 RepID=A0A916UKA1_9HYPH|nr:riboflavin synthase [Chelatococcus reniformis]GGC74023.1 riboflavin synthase subunit alpha [Chelatococcus reniformis]
MFTGIVTDLGEVIAAEDHAGKLRRLRIASSYDPAGIAIGASIACSGPCLTVVAVGAHGGGAWFDVDVAAETLERTNAGRWQLGARLNLERSLKIGDELGGHIVTGHIDGLAQLVGRDEITDADSPWGATARFTIRAPANLARFIAEKGSVGLDGTSLTVNNVERDVFSVLIIPHTLDVTTWGGRRPGDEVNLEVDLMARYAARLAEAQASGY